MDFFGSLLNDESQNNFDFLKDCGKEKKTNYSNNLPNFGTINQNNNSNNFHNQSFFSQSNNNPQHNTNYTPINNNNNNNYIFNDTPEDSYLTEKNHKDLAKILSSDAFDVGTVPQAYPNKQKISTELIDNLQEFEEMFMNVKPTRQNLTIKNIQNCSNSDVSTSINYPKNVKQINRNSGSDVTGMNINLNRQNYNTILEQDEETTTMNQLNYLKENLEREATSFDNNYKRYQGIERRGGEMRINKRTRGDIIERERDNQVRCRDKMQVECDQRESNQDPTTGLKKETNHRRMNIDYSTINHPNDFIGKTGPIVDDDVINNPGAKNSKKMPYEAINKKGNIYHPRNDVNNSSMIPTTMDNQPINPNTYVINNKNMPNEMNRMNDLCYVEKTKKNNKKVSLYTDRNVREATIHAFNMEFRALNNQLQEKKEKLKIMNNLTKYHEKLYSRIEDFKKKVPVFIEKYLDNYQKHLENYKLMVTLHDDEIDSVLNEYEERMEKIKEKFKI